MPFRLFAIFLFTAACPAQEAPPAPGQSPKVRINVLNVCTPSDAEQKELLAALSKIPTSPQYGPDYELSRGRSSGPDIPPARYVRLRKEFSASAAYASVQYSASVDRENIIETLIFRPKDTKEILQLSIEDTVSASSSPFSVISSDTPASRIKLERFGKASVVLAHCENADQSLMAPLFARASDVLAKYRQNLLVRTAFRSDFKWLGPASRDGKNPESRQH